jgi:hypothetical protein
MNGIGRKVIKSRSDSWGRKDEKSKNFLQAKTTMAINITETKLLCGVNRVSYGTTGAFGK